MSNAANLPRIGIIGYSGSGKTSVGNILAKLTGGKCANTGDFILPEYAKLMGIPLRWARRTKPHLRERLRTHGDIGRKHDVTHWVKLALAKGNIVTGMRAAAEVEAARELLDFIIWVCRPGKRPHPSDGVNCRLADEIVFNTSTGRNWKAHLREQCRAILERRTT